MLYLESMCTAMLYLPGLHQSSIWASTWLEKEADITKLGWPMAQPRLTRRPSARRIRFFPFCRVYLSTCGLMLVFCLQLSSSHFTWISQSKCPILQNMASFFICTKCLPVRMSLQPVVVTKMLHLLTQSSTVVTSYPSIAACRALIGSTSVMMTRQPNPRRDIAEPLPTSPYPATIATLPANITSVALLIPSTRDSLHPYKLSNLDLVTESLTLIAGT